MKFRKKPVIVDVEQFTNMQPPYPKGVCTCGRMLAGIEGGCQPHLHTIHEGQRVDLSVGDWIMPEPDGEHFYPCKPDIFENTYEPVTA